MKRALIGVVCAAAIACAAPRAGAAPGSAGGAGARFSAVEESAFIEEIEMYVGQVKTLSVSVPIRIVVGKPEIADVTEATDSAITFAAKASGTTTLIFWDNFGQQDYRIKVYSEEMRSTKERIDNLIAELGLPQVTTKAMESENKILLLGQVKTAQERERIFIAIGPLKDKVVDLLKIKEEEAVIDIDVQLLELNRDATRTLGFSWPAAITLTDVTGPVTAATTGFKNIFHVSDFTRTAFSATLDALVQEGKARVLSRPRLACQSGKEAELMVGGEKPILTTDLVSGGGSSTNVEYKEYGIKMKIKPVVDDKGRIKLGLNVEVSDVGLPVTLGPADEPTALAYPLTKRNIITELALNNGQTLAIGGLRKQKKEEDVRKTAVLGDIPVLGALFRRTETKIGGGEGERGDTELFITMTPTIVLPEEEPSPPTPPLPLPPAPVAVPFDAVDPLQYYTDLIKQRIMANLVYPSSARQAGFEGTVKLSLHLSYIGELLDVAVKAPSGHTVLDENAVAVAKGIALYPPFPPALSQKDLWVEIPIVYTQD